MLALFSKELNSYLHSLVAYIVIALFLVLTGLVLFIFPDSNVLDYGFAEMTSFFQLTPYILLFIVPAITMRTFSEEYKTGTIELLFTKPMTSFQIVLAKNLAAWVLLFLAILPTVVYYFIISSSGNPEGNIDTASVIGSYFGLILLAGTFTALGVFISSLTNNQIVAFLLSAFVCYLWYDGLTQIAGLFGGAIAYWLEYLGLAYHYNSLGKGVIDTRNLIFLVSIQVILMLLTAKILEGKKK